MFIFQEIIFGRLKEKKIRVYFMYAKTFQNLMCGKRLQGRGIANKFIIDVDNQVQLFAEPGF